MKPCEFKAYPSSNYLSGNFNSSFGGNNTPKKIIGVMKKAGAVYSNCLVCLYNRDTKVIIAARKPDSMGKYSFLGINDSVKYSIIAYDSANLANALIIDRVVPK